MLGRTCGAGAPNGDRPMSLDIQSRVGMAEFSEPEFESDLDSPWAENVVTAAGAAFTVLFVSSVAVLMYLA